MNKNVMIFLIIGVIMFIFLSYIFLYNNDKNSNSNSGVDVKTNIKSDNNGLNYKLNIINNNLVIYDLSWDYVLNNQNLFPKVDFGVSGISSFSPTKEQVIEAEKDILNEMKKSLPESALKFDKYKRQYWGLNTGDISPNYMIYGQYFLIDNIDITKGILNSLSDGGTTYIFVIYNLSTKQVEIIPNGQA
nr:hypothetical protein [Candidatus Gracilibacteria bacterium]